MTIGLDRNSATQPIRSCAATINTIPAHRAAAVVNSTACDTSAGRRAATRDPDITETVETGPTTNWREVPKIAYAMRARGTAYSPSSTGTPAMAA